MSQTTGHADAQCTFFGILQDSTHFTVTPNSHHFCRAACVSPLLLLQDLVLLPPTTTSV